MANPIVIVNVSQAIAPAPSRLQKTGALISQGATNLGVGNYGLLTQIADLVPLLATPLALTSLSWANSYGGQVTATTTVAHGIAINQQFVTTIVGALPAGYNGTVLATATGASTFAYYLGVNPGSETAPGTYTPRNVGELTAMATTFFSQGAQQSVYVLELGAGEPNAGVTALTAFINGSPQKFYSYLVPRNWDGNANFLAMLANYESTTSKTYFFITTTLQNYQGYTALMKDVVPMIEAPATGSYPSNVLTAAAYSGGVVTAATTTAHGILPGQYFTIAGATPAGYNGTFQALPGTTASALLYAVPSDPGTISIEGTLQAHSYASPGIPATEFSLAAGFYVALNYDPSSTNKVTPYAFSYLFGVTPFPTQGNSSLLTTLQAANISYVGVGAEGGISNALMWKGHTKDGNPFNYWYSVDWMQINVDLAIANAIFNGSNNPVNPLYYNQDGINRLEQVSASVGASAITFGLALGSVVQVGLNAADFTNNLNAGKYAGQLVVNAVPFVPYSIANPSDYAIGKYAGLSMVYTPLRGFEQIIFNIVVSSFVAG